ncbi:MAG: hypothetical protein HYW07_11650 [Candidatus Latescibacteria bacterium]|nr:hypothetical protein [Candidatus Latescibacterota bacterium]
MPPLRQRREDIPLLARHFLEIFSREMGMEGPELIPEALEVLEGYTFPGNVRELKNIIERALIESSGGDIRPEHLHLRPAGAAAADSPAAEEFVAGLPLDFQQAEVALIQRALSQTGGNLTEAARLLGINRAKIYRKLAQTASSADNLCTGDPDRSIERPREISDTTQGGGSL